MTCKKIVFFLFALAATTGCSVSVKFPSNHFISSETSGRTFGGEVDLRVYGNSEVEVITSRFASTPGQTPTQTENVGVGLGGELGVVDFVDVFVYTGDEAPVYAGAKVQVLGDGRANAKKGNFSVSIAGGLAFAGGSDTATEGAVESKAERDFFGYMLAASTGYRVHDAVLIYGGPFMSNVDAKVTLTRTENGTSTVTATPEGDFSQLGAALGLRWGNGGLYLEAEGSYAKNSYERTAPSVLKAEDLDEFFLGVNIGLDW